MGDSVQEKRERELCGVDDYCVSFFEQFVSLHNSGSTQEASDLYSSWRARMKTWEKEKRASDPEAADYISKAYTDTRLMVMSFRQSPGERDISYRGEMPTRYDRTAHL